jgi:hypothetical protein
MEWMGKQLQLRKGNLLNAKQEQTIKQTNKQTNTQTHKQTLMFACKLN